MTLPSKCFPETLQEDLNAFKEVQEEMGFSDAQLLGTMFFYFSSSGQTEKVVTMLRNSFSSAKRDISAT